MIFNYLIEVHEIIETLSSNLRRKLFYNHYEIAGAKNKLITVDGIDSFLHFI